MSQSYYIYDDDESSRMAGMKQRYDKIIGMFRDHHERITAYLNDANTKAFLEGEADFENPGHGLSRAEIVRRSLIYNTELLEVDLSFEELLDSHVAEFLHPSPTLLNFLL